LFHQSASKLQSLGLKPNQIKLLHDFTHQSQCTLRSQIQRDLDWLALDNNHILTRSDSRYPSLLSTIPSAPPVLFVKGDLDVLRFPQIAIVGSRHPTRQGKENAWQFAKHLVEKGFICTSGLAMGIDAAVHEGALAGDGYTVAVMAHGLDQIYPKRNQKLAEQVVESGVLISEYPIGVGPRAEYFPRRNRIVSGMSLGVLVVEAAKKSGSLITAREAIQQNREVFAIPGSIHNPLAKGCHELIRQGAKLVDSAEHLIEELSAIVGAHKQMELALTGLDEEPGNSLHVKDYPSGSVEEKLMNVLEYEPCSVDDLIQVTGLSVSEVNSALVMMELDGVISGTHQGYLLA